MFAKTTVYCLAIKVGLFGSCRLELQRACKERLEVIRGVGRGFGKLLETERMSIEQMKHLYEQALNNFGEIAEKSVNATSNNSCKRTFEQFQRFLAQNALG